ncbi:MAG: serine/threonine protein kinase [Deltaproteobacteria bacterium]|nr:serine/threonine protein kinase [Deltaproteobacteria bacterium]
MKNEQPLRRGNRLGKYRIRRRLGVGGFATVYAAYDEVEGIDVALKLPHSGWVARELLDDFRREVRIAARLDHPNILPLRSASFINERFVVVYALGQETLSDRLSRRLTTVRALSFSAQLLEALAYAHQHRVIHCDVKPENVILFPDGRARLADFGLAKVATRTVQASGSGTIGYMAPEQAMGSPSFRSDVFAWGLITYRMLAGELPRWPFEWPPPGIQRLRRRVSRDFVALLQRCLQPAPRGRFADAVQTLAAFKSVFANRPERSAMPCPCCRQLPRRSVR